MMRYIKLLPLCLAFLTAGCAEIVVKEVDFAKPIAMPQDAAPTPIKFSRLRFLLPPGTEIGLESGIGPSLLGSLCTGSPSAISRKTLSKKFEQTYLESSFEEALESQGYDVTNNVDLDYDYEDELARAEYFITARVVDIDLDLCRRGRVTMFNIFNSAPGAKGKIHARIRWSVYNALTRSVTYTTTTEGYSKRTYPNAEGLELLFLDAFTMAAHNLGTDKGFYDLIVNGVKPPKKQTKNKRPRQFSQTDPVSLPALPLHTQPFTDISESARKTAVTIQKIGHGSGFFISKDGHILTNAHVVGYSDKVRVILADREKALTAEVLRIDRGRDVALLRVINPPKQIETLPIQTTWPIVGADIYAIGTPMHYSRMENTVSKGIVSNHRKTIKSAECAKTSFRAT